MQTLTEKIIKLIKQNIKISKDIIKNQKNKKQEKKYTPIEVEEIILDDNKNLLDHINKIIKDHNTQILWKALKEHDKNCIKAQKTNRYIDTMKKFIKEGGKK